MTCWAPYYGPARAHWAAAPRASPSPLPCTLHCRHNAASRYTWTDSHSPTYLLFHQIIKNNPIRWLSRSKWWIQVWWKWQQAERENWIQTTNSYLKIRRKFSRKRKSNVLLIFLLFSCLSLFNVLGTARSCRGRMLGYSWCARDWLNCITLHFARFYVLYYLFF